MWDRWNAKLIDLAPRLSVERVLGDLMPDGLITSFRGSPDEFGRFDWVELTRCPLSYIDPRSPAASQLDWLSDLAAYGREVASKLPSQWLPLDPTNVLREGLVILRGETEAAAAHRSTKKESW